jgi:hypothetical protein
VQLFLLCNYIDIFSIFILAKVNVSPLFQLSANFLDCSKLPANSEFNSGAFDKFSLLFSPHKLLVNGKVALSPDALNGIDTHIKCKVDIETWTRLSTILRDKKGQPFILHVSPEAYAIGNNSGVWYQLYNVDPITK